MKNSYKTFIRNFISLLLCILVTWQAWEVSRESRNGAVSSTSKIASDVGIDVLKKGGNAFDAIVATGFALAVTSPANGNIGGGGFLVAHTASGESISLDFREKAPKLSYESMFLNDNGEYDRTIALESHKSSGVPGTVNGLLKILNDYGSGNPADVVIQDYGTDKALGSVTGNVQFTANVSSSVLTLTAISSVNQASNMKYIVRKWNAPLS